MVLYNYADNLLFLGILHGHHDNVGVVKFCHVDKFHVAIAVEANFAFVLAICSAFFKFDIVNLNVKLVSKVEVRGFYYRVKL